MEKSFVAKKLDFIFISAVLYILLFIFYFYLYERALYSMALSVLSLLVIHLFYYGITKGKKAKNKQTKEEQKHCKKIFYSLPYLSISAQLTFLKKLFEKAGFTTLYQKDVLTISKDGIKRNIYPSFKKTPDLTAIYNCEGQRQESNSKGFILLCIEPTNDAAAAVANIGNDKNIVLNKKSLYALMKKYNLYPPILYTEKQNKKHIKELFLYTFNRDRFKGYFILGAVMFLFSFISPFRNYYLSFSAVLFIFCLFTLLSGNGKKNKNDDEIEL